MKQQSFLDELNNNVQGLGEGYSKWKFGSDGFPTLEWITDEMLNPEPSLSGDGTLEYPYSATDALTITKKMAADQKSESRYYIQGKISSIKYTFNQQYGTATFNISDNGSTSEPQFTIYATYYLSNRPWVNGDIQIKIGDEVIVYGKIVNYKGTIPETADKDSYIYTLNGVDNTRIDLVKTEKHKNVVYNLNGQTIRLNASTPEHLLKGVYIVNGKKVVAK